MESQNSFLLLGLMSGTSLDGLDLAVCQFDWNPQGPKYTLIKAETREYPSDLHQVLACCTTLSGEQLSVLDIDLGKWMGQQALDFIRSNELKPSHIASHGHTVFHQPHLGLSKQIGNGQAIAIASGLPVITNFREKDVLLGGQGAPLVPIGDKMLFADYTHCLNLGGISNISCDWQGQRIAYDIGPCNLLLNHLAGFRQKPYDEGGKMAAAGKVLPDWWQYLEALDYYHQPYPKSLGYEWVHQHILMKLPQHATPEDLLHTAAKHAAHRIAQDVNALPGPDTTRVLITGGGAFNSFLIQSIREYSSPAIQWTVPEAPLIQFKEALVFAFLGALNLRGEINCLASVTGASRDSSGGILYYP
jgi:anhydro-N-acetylmuramic acid kinase